MDWRTPWATWYKAAGTVLRVWRTVLREWSAVSGSVPRLCCMVNGSVLRGDYVLIYFPIPAFWPTSQKAMIWLLASHHVWDQTVHKQICYRNEVHLKSFHWLQNAFWCPKDVKDAIEIQVFVSRCNSGFQWWNKMEGKMLVGFTAAAYINGYRVPIILSSIFCLNIAKQNQTPCHVRKH